MKRILSVILTLCLTLLPATVQVRAASAQNLRYEIVDGKVTITDFDTYPSGSLTIPDTIGGCPVTSIGDDAFRDCKKLTSVTIPDGVTSIGKNAFSGCKSLTSVTIPDSVTSIRERAFENCDGLTSVPMGDSVTGIENGVFYDCDGLTSVTFPDSVTSIGDSAFADCDGLTSVTIPDSVTSIGSGAFRGCFRLTSVTIPDSVTSIGSYAFYDCGRLTSVMMGDSVTSIGWGAFFQCGSLRYNAYGGGKYLGNDGNPYVVLLGVNDTSITSVDIHSDTKFIGDNAFDDCGNLTSVTIPDSVTGIGDHAFRGCESLTSVTIGNGVTSIGGYAFWGCESLTSVTIGNGVTSIGGYAFSYCDSLTSVTIPDSVTSIESYAFTACTSLTSIYFAGNAPSDADVEYAFNETCATVYYHTGTTGWTNADYRFWTCGLGKITFCEVDHIWSSFTYDNNHTCTEDGTERAVCLTCGETDVRKAEGTAAHQYVNGICIFCDQLDPSFTWAELTGKLTASGKGTVQLTLTPVGQTTPTATQTATDISYRFQVVPGDYILTVSQEGAVTRTYMVTLTERETALDVKLQQNGDVTGDGKVNIIDVAKLYAHVKGTPITDEYSLTCGDTTGDGKCNIMDVAKLYAHIKTK